MTDYASVAAHTETFDVVIEPCVPEFYVASNIEKIYVVGESQLVILVDELISQQK